MNIVRTVGLALRTLSRNRLRSFFMMLGVTIGIASLTALASVGEATRQETMRRFKNMLGTFDVVIMQSRRVQHARHALGGHGASGAQGGGREGHRQRVSRLSARWRPCSSPWTSTSSIGTGGEPVRHRCLAQLDRGARRGQSPSAAASARRTRPTGPGCRLGQDVRQSLFPDEDPIGKQLRIADVPFQVKGVLASRGVGPGGASMDNLLVIPVATASRRLFNRDYFTGMMAQLKDPEQSERGHRRYQGAAARAPRHRAAGRG